MSESNRALLFISCLCLALCSFNNASAQEENRLSAREENKAPAPAKIVRPDFGDGVFEEVADKMERLLELEWKGESIGLKRGWDEKKKKKAAGDEEDQELKERIESSIENGVPEAEAERMAKLRARHFRGMGFDRERSGVEKAFFAIPTRNGGVSSGSGGSGASKRVNFKTASLSGSGILAKDDLQFKFTENDASERSFELRDTGDGKVQFTFSYGQFFPRFLQTKKGKTQLILIDQDRAEVYVADTFADFVQEHSRPAKKILFPLFERLGIKMPLDKMDP